MELKIKKLLEDFLIEDIGYFDLTTSLFEDREVKAEIKFKEEGVLCGAPFVLEIFNILGGVSVKLLKSEGSWVNKSEVALELYGSAHSILKGERVSLNILQSLSGIATNSKRYSDIVSQYNVKILDTRKTTPGYRFFEKYAVKVGGSENHRFGLYDMILVKDNHIAIAGSIDKALEILRNKKSFGHKIEIEVKNLEELKKVIALKPDIVLLDNFSIEDAKVGIEILRKNNILSEISGNINLSNLGEYAKLKPDFISSGSIIYSARWLDISLKIF